MSYFMDYGVIPLILVTVSFLLGMLVNRLIGYYLDKKIIEEIQDGKQ